MPGVCQSYKDEVQQIKKIKTLANEPRDDDAGFSGSHKIQVHTFNSTIYNLVNGLDHRLDAHKHE